MADKTTLTEQQTGLSFRDGLISLLVHATIFALIFWLTPLHELVLPPKTADQKQKRPQESSLAKDQSLVKEAVDRIKELQAENAKARVEQLIETEQKMDQKVKDRVDDFNKEAEDLAKQAPQAALEQMKKAVGDQERVMQEQDQLTAQTKAMLDAVQKTQQANTDPATTQAALAGLNELKNQINQHQDQAKKEQVTTIDDQNKTVDTLNFVPTTMGDAIDAQKKANAAQNASLDSQQRATDVRNGAIWLLMRSLGAANMQMEIQKKQAELEQLNNTELPAMAKQVTDDMSALQLAEQALQQAQAQPNQDITKAAKTDADAKRSTLKKSQNLLTARQHEQENRIKQLESMRNRPQGEGPDLAQLAQKAAALETMQNKAHEDQAAAHQLQVDLVNKLAAQATQVAATPPPPPPPDLPATPDAKTLENKDLAQLYQSGKDAENRIAEKYKTYRAAEMASIRKIPLAEAIKYTQIARPDREKLDMDLLAAKDATHQFTKYKEQVTKANQQLDSMVSLSQQMLAVAIKQEHQEELEEHGPHGHGPHGHHGMHGDIAFSNWAVADDQMAGKDLTSLTKSPDAPDLGIQMPVYPRNAPELPVMDYEHLKPLDARRIGKSTGTHADWLYVGSWYLIGPFPNPGRRNLNTKFPPESIIDLDAVYPGKNDQPIRWKFMQWNNPNIHIPNDLADAPAIYYAYTELNFDEPQDLWIATGSDDKGTMWLNDILVWNSNDNLKAWLPNEGYRKVHFIKGRNRVLYRLENAQLNANLSLMLSTKQK